MEIWQGVLLFGVGIVSGFLNVMAGGGSLISLPVMVFLGISAPVANGTNRIAILVQNISAVTTFFRKGFSDFRLSLSLAAATLPGAVIGAFAGTRLDGQWFEWLLAATMLAVMLLMAFGKDRPVVQKTSVQPSAKRMILGHLLMAGVGFYGGLIQIGVGFIIMPVLHRVLGLDLVRVNMHKVFIIGIYTIVALIIFASQVEILWLLGLCLAAGTAIGGWLGAHVSIQKGERAIRILLNIVLTGFIIKLLLF